jgi:hydrogenase-4 component B
MTLFLLALALLFGGGCGAILAGRKRLLATILGGGGAVAGSFVGLLAAGQGLLATSPLLFNRPWSVPGGSFALVIDGLAAFFLLPIFLLALLCAVYGSEYMQGLGPERSPGWHWLLFNTLVAVMALVVTAANGILFLAVWEIMSLSSFLLVAFEHRQGEVRQAAWLYLLATHLGTACLFGLFLLAGQETGSLDFSSFSALAGLPSSSAAVFFLLALVGFGTKAGLFPLHVWLPEAHAAAPSHISALMSGVMIKTGIYGLLRFCTFLPPAPAWWGGTLMVLGIMGALFGIALAAMQRDLKRCLAFSTVENVGIVFLALGLGMFAVSRGLTGVAVLAWTGGLLHLWNHALFKGLLFLGAGSIAHATESRDMNRLGGVLQRMPATGSLLIGGSVAIAALPPLNGFVGEWLIYLGLLQAGQGAAGFSGLFPLFLAGLLALTGGMVLLVFTRLIGISLLGQARSTDADQAHDPGLRMLIPMALLFMLCLLIGFFPVLVLSWIAVPVALFVSPAAILAQSGALYDGTRALSGVAAGLLLLLICAVVFLLWVRARRSAASAATWGCGFAQPTARMSYSAAGFSELAQRHLLPQWLRPCTAGGAPQGLFPKGEELHQQCPDPVLQRVFAPFFQAAARHCVRLRWLQQGRLHVYLLYIFITCALLMVWVLLVEGRLPW